MSITVPTVAQSATPHAAADAIVVEGLEKQFGRVRAVDENLTGHENLEMFGRLYRMSARRAR
jgi:hypothetical protein